MSVSFKSENILGRIQHNAFIVTGIEIVEAHALATKIFGGLVSPLVPSAVDGVQSFMIAPDGSKEGWSTSDKYDKLRKKFKTQLRKLPKFSGCWVEVSFGEDENDRVVAGTFAPESSTIIG